MKAVKRVNTKVLITYTKIIFYIFNFAIWDDSYSLNLLW